MSNNKKEIQLKNPNTCEHYKEVGCIKDVCECYTLVPKQTKQKSLKNIFVLPTDKPILNGSVKYILKCIKDFELYGEKYKKGYILNELNWDFDSKYWQPQNIYITSDEEIKEGDYFYQGFDCIIHKCYKLTNNYVIAEKPSDYPKKICKKIILTTDQDLIKDGVQAIPDDFLEWFVKNPSCEFVQLLRVPYFDESGFSYKIIIPKEEPKQETYWVGVVKWNDGTILRTEPFYDYDNGIKEWSSKFSYENKGKFEWIDYEKFEKPKQETLEEFAERTVKEHPDFKAEGFSEYQNGRFNGIIEGAKWQQEQDKNKYSEEDMIQASKYGYNFHKTTQFPEQDFEDSCIRNTQQWLTQFKKETRC